MSALTCPKCHGHMRQYERNGVYVDQCADCRGIFLDHGELERLIDAEARWSDDDRDDHWDDDRYDDRRRSQHFGGHQRPHEQKRKRSFLEGLFDD
jgi:Zn-finger nucleic acid-binding protein